MGVMLLTCLLAAAGAGEEGAMTMEGIRSAQWRFDGELGRRIDANVEQWLLRTPDVNPGLIEMFRRRDRHLPYATPVPWAGEFAGKYLISAVQALRMSDDARLRPQAQAFVDALVASQAEDGYLHTSVMIKGLERYSHRNHHEMYNSGHLLTSACIHHRVTGKRNFLNIAEKKSELVSRLLVQFNAGWKASLPESMLDRSDKLRRR